MLDTPIKLSQTKWRIRFFQRGLSVILLLGIVCHQGHAAISPPSPHQKTERNYRARGALECKKWTELRSKSEAALTPDEFTLLSVTLGWINGYMAALEMERKNYSSNTDYDTWWDFLDKGCKKFPDYDIGRFVEALYLVLPELSKR
jgi:hypothetical protein